MINLYQLLGVPPAATAEQIQKAITAAAQKQSLPLETLQKCQAWLLNQEKRKQYDAKLFAEHPEILAAATNEINKPWQQGKGVYPDGFIDFFKFFNISADTDPKRIAEILAVAAQDGVDEAVITNAKMVLLNPRGLAHFAKRRKAYLTELAKAKRLQGEIKRLRKQPQVELTLKQSIVITAGVFLLGGLLALPASCSGKKTKNTAATVAASTAPSADMSGFVATRQLIPVGEPSAEYYLIFYKKLYDRLETVVERQGSSGVSYAWREMDCASGTQRYLGSGDSLNEVMVLRPDPEMKIPVENSSAGRTLDFACRNL